MPQDLPFSRPVPSPEALDQLSSFEFGPERKLRDYNRVYAAVRTLQRSLIANAACRSSDLQLLVFSHALQRETGRKFEIESRPDQIERSRKAADAILVDEKGEIRWAVEVTQWLVDPNYLKDQSAQLSIAGGIAQHLGALPRGAWHVIVCRSVRLLKRMREQWCQSVATQILHLARTMASGQGLRVTDGVGLAFDSQREEPQIAFHFERPHAGPRSKAGGGVEIVAHFRRLLEEATIKFQGCPDRTAVIVQMTLSIDHAHLLSCLSPLKVEFPQIDRLAVVPTAASLDLLDVWTPGAVVNPAPPPPH